MSRVTEKNIKKPQRIGSWLLTTAMVISAFIGVLWLQIYAEGSLEGSKTVLYVAPNESSDYTGNGSIENPFTSIIEANERIAEMTKEQRSGGITVYIRGGIYYQPGTLNLTLSGTAGAPIIYKAYEDETPVIDGGYRLNSEDFRVPEASEIACIKDETARNKVMIYDLRAAGLDVISQYELFYDGNRGTLARYPNAWNPEEPPLSLSNVAAEESSGTASFTCDADNIISTWHSTEGVLLEGHFYIDWVQTDGILADYDAENGRITVNNTSKIKDYRNGGRYYFRNVLDEIDIPGEYYISPTGLLYYYPAGDIHDSKVTYSQCKDTLVQVSADYLTFDGLTIEDTAGAAFSANGNGITVKNCKIGCCRLNGVSVKGYNNYIYNNEIAHVGYTALYMKGGDLALGIPSNSVADNNYIHDFGEVKTVYEQGIHAEGTGFTFTHNEIAYCPHAAVGTDGRDIIMKYNHIHDVCREGGDARAVYIAWWSNQNLVFENNFVENVYNIYKVGAPNGFYCDDGGSGKIVRKNLFYNVAGQSIFMGGGKDNIVVDNVVIGGPDSYNGSIWYDSRTWYNEWLASHVMLINGLVQDSNPLTYKTNIWDNLFGDEGYATEQWSMRYPRTMFYKTTTAKSVEDRYIANASANAVIRNNVVYPEANIIQITIPIRKFAVIHNNMYIPRFDMIGFEDFENRDFSISENTIIYHDIPGFKAYDFYEIGMKKP